DTLVQQEWLIEHVAIKQAQFLEVIRTHCALLNMTTWSTGAICDGLVQFRHPIPFEVNMGLENLGQAIILHQSILYQWQHSLEHLALKPIAHTPAPRDIVDEVQEDLLSTLEMSEFEDEEGDDLGPSEQS
ncbi:hypothetical protein C0995_005373, partial [Termitomyces sp. Mi166